jgi:outer membrane protein OmpA-like peptidoglycan-associated protein
VELNKLLRIMQENPNMVIEIIGHTDSIGDDDYNKFLSRCRSKAVVMFLLENKIRPARLRYRGAGEHQPIATNETEDGRAQNRRVEFVVVRK